MVDQRPLGELFSRVYLEKSSPTQDSLRFRKRLGHYLQSMTTASYAVSEIAKETGEKVASYGGGFYWDKFTRDVQLRDLLDSITIIYRVVSRSVVNNHQAEPFREFVERALREENLGYSVDARGGVHFFVDEQFERSRVSLIAGLHAPRYAGIAAAIEESHRALAGAEPDTLEAVRRAFDAVENLFKLMFAVPRLGSSEIGAKLKPSLPALFPGRAGDASKLIADAMSAWVNACHQYRHAPSDEQPAPPPLSLALTLIGSASDYLRWLAGIDAQMQRS